MPGKLPESLPFTLKQVWSITSLTSLHFSSQIKKYIKRCNFRGSDHSAPRSLWWGCGIQRAVGQRSVLIFLHFSLLDLSIPVCQSLLSSAAIHSAAAPGRAPCQALRETRNHVWVQLCALTMLVSTQLREAVERVLALESERVESQSKVSLFRLVWLGQSTSVESRLLYAWGPDNTTYLAQLWAHCWHSTKATPSFPSLTKSGEVKFGVSLSLDYLPLSKSHGQTRYQAPKFYQRQVVVGKGVSC